MSKKSFILFQEYKENLSSLSQNQKGDLLDAIFAFNDDDEIDLEPLTKMAFSFIKSDLQRNKESWNRSIVSGKIGNLKKYHEEIYKKYNSGELTLEKAENMAYPHKREINSRPPITPDHPPSLNVNDNVNVNVNDIIKSQDLPKKPKPKYNDFQFQIAEQLGNHVKNIKNINLTIGNIKKWAGDIRLLQEQDLKPRSNSQHDIINAMQSILDNTGKEYFPQIESGSAFRSKFSKIENYKKTTKTTKQEGMKGAFLDFIND